MSPRGIAAAGLLLLLQLQLLYRDERLDADADVVVEFSVPPAPAASHKLYDETTPCRFAGGGQRATGSAVVAETETGAGQHLIETAPEIGKSYFTVKTTTTKKQHSEAYCSTITVIMHVLFGLFV